MEKIYIDANNLFTQTQDFNRIVFVDGDNKISMQQFMQDIADYATYFNNFEQDDVILHIKDEVYLFYVMFMGLLQAQKNIILPAFLSQDNSNILANLSSKIITNIDIANDNFDIEIIKQVVPAVNPVKSFGFTNMANRYLYFFTSGSTGTPKTIKKQFHNLAAESLNIYNLQKDIYTDETVLIASISPCHMYGMLWRFLFPLTCNLISDLNSVFYPEELQNKQAIYKNVVFATSPSLMDKIVDYKHLYSFKANCLAIYSSGSALKTKTSKQMYELFKVSPTEILGSTETGGIGARQQHNGANYKVFPVVKIKLDQDNCLHVTSPFVYKDIFQTRDAAEILDDNHFKYLGRVDRMVKIAEKRVSLPEMEERYLEHPFIKDVHVIHMHSYKDILASVICLTDEGNKYLIEHGCKSLNLKLNTYLKSFFDTTAIPRKVKFINKIPNNSQGKIMRASIESILNSKVIEPVLENITINNNTLTADATFLKEAEYFKGHFPSLKLLPGVVQTHFAVYFLKLFFNLDLKIFDVNKLKFSNIIFPQEKVILSLKIIDESKIEFSFHNENNLLCSSGIIVEKK